MTPCVEPVGISDATAGDIWDAAMAYKKAFLQCAAKVDAIRKDDAEKRAIYSSARR